MEIKKTRWNDSCKQDMERLGLKEDGALGRTKWKNVGPTSTPPMIPATHGKSPRRRTTFYGDCSNISNNGAT